MMRGKVHQDLEVFLDRDREDEILGFEEFTEEDYAFLEEFQELAREFQ